MRLIFVLITIFLLARPLAADTSVDLFNDLNTLAVGGDVEAQYYLGMLYNNGIGTKKSYEKALPLFEISAKAGHPLAVYKLGDYYGGQGSTVVELNQHTALAYKLIAADAGYSFAQHDVGDMYRDRGELKLATKYWKLAAAQNYPFAMDRLQTVYLGGGGAEANLSLAYAYTRLSERANYGRISPSGAEIMQRMRSFMTKEELERANDFVLDWKPKKTALTIKGQSGLEFIKNYVVERMK